MVSYFHLKKSPALRKTQINVDFSAFVDGNMILHSRAKNAGKRLVLRRIKSRGNYCRVENGKRDMLYVKRSKLHKKYVKRLCNIPYCNYDKRMLLYNRKLKETSPGTRSRSAVKGSGLYIENLKAPRSLIKRGSRERAKPSSIAAWKQAAKMRECQRKAGNVIM